MSTNNHTAISTGAAANAGTINGPLGTLDAAIGDISAFDDPSLAVIIANALDTDGTLKAGAVDVAAVLADNVVSADKIADNVIGATYVAGTDLTLEDLSDRSPASISATNLDLVDGVTDADDVPIWGITAEGGAYVGGEIFTRAPVNNRRVLEAVLDANGRLAGGYRRDGAAIQPTTDWPDIMHILSTGQSLSVGGGGGTAVTTSDPFGNMKFTDDTLASFAELANGMPEGSGPDTYEVPNLAMGRMLSHLAALHQPTTLPFRQLHSIHGIGASAYDDIKKGGLATAYATGMDQMAAGMSIAQRQNMSYRVGAVTLIHGESDYDEGTTYAEYLGYLKEFQADYNSDIGFATGVDAVVPMVLYQMSNWCAYGGASSDIPAALLDAATQSPGRIYCVGPGYQFNYNAGDKVHMTAESYQWLGEYFGKALYAILVEKRAWQPLRPMYVSRSAAVVTAVFHVPVGYLEFDTTLVTDPGDYGFEWYDAGDGNTVTISSVAIAGPNVVTVTLDGTPTGTDQRLRYAYSNPAGVSTLQAGNSTGPRGNLRDRDMTPSPFGHTLYNWCVAFNEVVN
jgi:hypothetical protein